MRNIYKFTKVFMFAWFFSAFVFPKEVQAYIDAGSGSFLTQVIVGIVLGGLFTIKSFWGKIISTVSKDKFKLKKPNGHVRSK